MMSDTDRIIAVMPDLLGALETAEAFIKAVIEGYATHVSHHDYRVQVAVWAEDALPEVSAAIKKAKGQSDGGDHKRSANHGKAWGDDVRH